MELVGDNFADWVDFWLSKLSASKSKFKSQKRIWSRVSFSILVFRWRTDARENFFSVFQMSAWFWVFAILGRAISGTDIHLILENDLRLVFDLIFRIIFDYNFLRIRKNMTGIWLTENLFQWPRSPVVDRLHWTKLYEQFDFQCSCSKTKTPKSKPIKP